MTRNEIINQLNLEKKRKENAVWEEWFATESSGNVTSARLQKRTADLRRIQNEYDDAVFKINNTPIKESLLPKTNTSRVNTQNIPNQSVSRASLNTPKNAGLEQIKKRVEKTSPNDDILKGAENLPENKPLTLGRTEPKRNIDGIQSQKKVPDEPFLVQQAREQNRSEEIRMTQNENREDEEVEDNDPQQEEGKNIDSLRAEAIREEFQAADIPISEITEAKTDKDLVDELKEAKKTSSVNFPLVILSIALAKDCSDILSSILETIPGLGVLIWIMAAGFSLACSVVIWFWMLGKGSKMQRRLIVQFVGKRLPLILGGLCAELIPYVSLIPTTTITVFFIAQASTKVGQVIHKAVEKAENLKK